MKVRSVVAFGVGFWLSWQGADGQCGYEWVGTGQSPGASGGPIVASVAWDPDGAGPLRASVVLGGQAFNAGGMGTATVARWDGVRWHPMTAPGPAPGSVTAACTWDRDGTGPLPEVVVLSGPGFAPLAWNGTGWSQAYPGSSGDLAIGTWDPDGTGPLHDELLVVNFSGMHRISGSGGTPFGAGTAGVRRAVSWDPDGGGPLAERLIVAGTIQPPTGPLMRIAAWNGAGWDPLGAGSSTDVPAMQIWDPDGAGPLGDQVVAAGSFSNASGAFGPLGRWDGSEWAPIAGISGVPASLAVLRAGEQRVLAAGGLSLSGAGFTGRRAAMFDGEAWTPLPDQFTGDVRTMAALDHDAPGGGELILAGSLVSSQAWMGNGVVGWDGATVRRLGQGFGGAISGIAAWDQDGAGPATELLLVGGSFASAPGTTNARLVTWDGTGWTAALGPPSSLRISCVGTWDPDGGGPAQARPVVTTKFESATNPATYVHAWEGGWSVLGLSLRGSNADAMALCGAGSQLFVGGSFDTEQSGVYLRKIAQLVGGAWFSAGNGFDSTVNALAYGDPDGPGPQPPQLIAGGTFALAAGLTPVSRIARLSPDLGWQPLGAGLSSTVQAVTFWDADGDGPGPARLIAGGSFLSSGATSTPRLAAWSGTAWESIGAVTGTNVLALTSWDPDGAGPLNPHLVVGGSFSEIGGVQAASIATYDGVRWQALGSGIAGSGSVAKLGTWDGDGAGPAPAWLAVAGIFGFAGGEPSASFAWYRAQIAPSVITSPISQVALQGAEVVLEASYGGSAPLALSWTLGGVPLVDGATPHGSTITGSATPVLRIVNAQPQDSGSYVGRASNPCGSAETGAADVQVHAACYPNCDQSTAAPALNVQDFTCFLQRYAAGESYANCDLSTAEPVLNVQDFTCFLQAYAAGCP